MEHAHALLGPSSWKRSLTCTPSARFEEQQPDSGESVFAKEGTLAHELGALVLSSRSGLFIGDTTAYNQLMESWQAQIIKFYIEEMGEHQEDAYLMYLAMLEHAENWASYMIDILHEDMVSSELYIEKRFDISEIAPQSFGTSDAGVKTPRVLHVGDLKFGQGQLVSAVWNYQGMAYALGALLQFMEEDPEYYPDVVVIHIYQPRAGSGEPSRWEIDTDELLSWAHDFVKPRAKLAYAGRGEFVAGDHCQFCKAAEVCRARYLHFAHIAGMQDKREMADHELAFVIENANKVAQWATKVKARAFARLAEGHQIAGYKVIKTEGNRSFKNIDDVVDRLLPEGIELFEEPKMLALTKIESLVGVKRFKTLLGDLIIKPEALKMVPASDPRPAVGGDLRGAYDTQEDLTI